ncbi:methylglyoxal reductase (NADPH-dependent) gre2 [Borealophlyctis nickersoniae]|nr:methylglyoxal reductase (NADPH-dependent) gre2 [Borealophlyctis nickersoniae]
MVDVSKKTALVTGVTGYIAAHVADQLLAAGYKVRGTARSPTKAQYLLDLFKDKYGEGKFEIVTVEDLQKEGAFDEAVKDQSIIFHVASPFHASGQDPYADYINPAVNGTLSLLNAAHTHGSPSRVVVTSSFAAMMHTPKEKGHIYSEKDWNESSIQHVKEKGKDSNPLTSYLASKTEAEKAAWKFVEDKKPKFDLVCIHPVYVFGPTIHHIASKDDINTSVAMIFGYLTGNHPKPLGPRKMFENFVDVRDVATAHVKAATLPAASGKRFITSAGGFSSEKIAQIIAKRFPELKGKVPVVEGDVKEPDTEADNTAAREVLGIKFRSLEESVVDTVESVKRFA